ncbi:MAG TPA: TraR/DksA C4-type zinc finger protein [Methylomirabilota bacterium]|jgi:DnaK suppressor protein
MDEIKKRLERELSHTMQRIRHMGGVMTYEDLGAGRVNNTTPADEVDVIRLNEDREMSFATRSLLVERANKLAEALDRLRGGEYGVCEECGEAIAPARLRAMPEVTTCVRCQDRLERMLPRLEAVGAGVDTEENEEE